MGKSMLGYHRTSCRLCDSSNLELAVKFPEVPLAERYLSKPREVSTFPVDIYWCHDCKHVQQLDVVNPEILWGSYIYTSSNSMSKHFEEFSQTVDVVGLVVDVGSNDGSLLLPFRKKGCKILGIDASKEAARTANQRGIPTVPGMLTVELAKAVTQNYGYASLVTAFNVFAHTDDLSGMLEAIKVLLSPEGRFIFEAQYLGDILDRTLMATLFHEHLSHHSITSLSSFFKRHGMKLIDVKRNNVQHGSIIGTVVFESNNIEVDDSVTDLLWAEERITLESVKRFGERVKKIRESITYEGWGYGAAHSGPTLISLLDLKITKIIDDHPDKVGKWYGNIPIFPTDELYKALPEYCFILAWVHSEKIVKDNQKYLDKGGKFVILCPDFRVIHA